MIRKRCVMEAVVKAAREKGSWRVDSNWTVALTVDLYEIVWESFDYRTTQQKRVKRVHQAGWKTVYNNLKKHGNVFADRLEF